MTTDDRRRWSDGAAQGDQGGVHAEEPSEVDEAWDDDTWALQDWEGAPWEDEPVGAHVAGPDRRHARGGAVGVHRRRGHPVLAALVALVVVTALVALGVGIHLKDEISPGGRPGRLVDVTIPQGASSAEIGTVLARAGVISGPSLFHYYVSVRHAGPLLPGSYTLASHEGYSAVIAVLEKGPAVVPVAADHLVVPEGYTLAQIAQRVQALPGYGLSAARFLAASSSGAVRSPYEPTGVNDLEGLVFPATYDVTRAMSEADVMTAMVKKFDDEATTVGLAQRAAALAMTPYQVVTVASIVEREAKLVADRPGVASTIYNRLRVGMTLGADSTLVYALRQADPGLDVTKIDYNQANVYNTRQHKGLPPTPIANPGLPSLTAATSPPVTSYLYFVEVNPDGQLGFASTTGGFDQLTAECRAAHLC